MDGRHSQWLWGQPSSQPVNPNNLYFQNLAFQQPQNLPFQQSQNLPHQQWQQTPNFPYTFPLQNPSFPLQQQQQLAAPGFQFQSPPQNRENMIEKVDKVVAQARRDLIAAGKSVSSWKVAESVIVKLKVDSWSSLGFPMQQVPSLYKLILVEGKVINLPISLSLCFFFNWFIFRVLWFLLKVLNKMFWIVMNKTPMRGRSSRQAMVLIPWGPDSIPHVTYLALC